MRFPSQCSYKTPRLILVRFGVSFVEREGWGGDQMAPFKAVTVICGESEATDNRVLPAKRKGRAGGEESLYFVVHFK